MDIRKIVDFIGAAIGAALGAAFAGWSWTPMHTVLVIFMLIDYASGVMVAALGLSPKSETGKLSSKAGFIGLAKKCFIVFFVLLGAALDSALGTTVIQSMIICMYIANEGLSIIENASLLGMPVPKALANALEVMKEKSESENAAVLKMRKRVEQDNQSGHGDQGEKPPDETI